MYYPDTPRASPLLQESDDDESIMSSHISDFGSPMSGVMPPPVTPKDMVSRKLRFDAESRRASSTPTPKPPLVSCALRIVHQHLEQVTSC